MRELRAVFVLPAGAGVVRRESQTDNRCRKQKGNFSKISSS